MTHRYILFALGLTAILTLGLLKACVIVGGG